MFGRLLFGHNYFATLMGEHDAGQLWVDQCPNTDVWGNLPLENSGWNNQPQDTADWDNQKENIIITKRCI